MSPKQIYISLRPAEAEALLELCRREDRDPRRQAARLLREGLLRAGALPTDNALTTDSREPAGAA